MADGTRGLLLGPILLLLVGCAGHRAPDKNPPFQNIQNIQQLEGTYKNLGSGDPSLGRPEYISWLKLSWIIFGPEHFSHDAIDRVRITNDSALYRESALTVSAFKNDEVVETKHVYEGIDYELKQGKINWEEGPRLFAHLYPAPVTGWGHREEVLGLNTAGNLKYRLDQTTLALFVGLPVIGTGTDEVIFKKIE